MDSQRIVDVAGGFLTITNLDMMQQYLPQIDEQKLQRMLEIRQQYAQGSLSLVAAREALRHDVGAIKPWELAYAEQQVATDDVEECMREDLAELRSLFLDLLHEERPELPKDHPLDTYYRENDAVMAIVTQMNALYAKPYIKNPWLECFEKIEAFKIHLSRKQNQLYALLEQKGFDRPSSTMWHYDNMVRDQITQQHNYLRTDQQALFWAHQPELMTALADLIDKENTVLFPTALQLIDEQEFKQMRLGDMEIGYCLVVPPTGFLPHDAPTHVAANSSEGLALELAQLLSKYGYAAPGLASGEVLDVATGKLTLEQINLIYQHLPVDLSFVDENELVQFYSDTTHRVFPRSRGVIGRMVKNCHPPKSVHIVEEIIDKFRRGEQDKAEFWINKPDLFIYILYVAVRDANGRFRGVLEMMQDCTRIRQLEGSQTLLQWQSDATPHASAELAEHAPEVDAPLVLTSKTKIAQLLAHYPQLKYELTEVDERLKMLQTPMVKVMLPFATIELVSKRLGMDEQVLIDKIQQLIQRLS